MLLAMLSFPGCGKEAQPTEPAAEPVQETQAPVPVNFDLDKEVLYFGRTYKKSNIRRMNWSGSGFTFRFKGSGVTAEFSTNAPDIKDLAYLKVYVDGVEMDDVLLKEESQTVVLAKGLDPNKEHIVEVRKRTNARSSTAGVRWIEISDGTVLEPPQPKDKLIEALPVKVIKKTEKSTVYDCG